MDTILTIRKKNISMSQVATGVQIEEWGLVHIIGDAATVHVGVAQQCVQVGGAQTSSQSEIASFHTVHVDDGTVVCQC